MENPKQDNSPVPPPQSHPLAGDKPQLNLSDKEAQALLALNNVSVKQSRSKPPLKLLIMIGLLLAFVLIASFMASAFKPATKPNSNGLGLPNQSNPSNSQGVTNQINRDVKTCSNPLNATLVC